jgi:beta-N-acetylhexosaminidase
MTLEEKIGQLMVIGFDRTTVDPDLRRMITEYHVGGVILFAHNIQSPQQVAALTNELQQIALESGHPGLFISIDQEGGRVARLTEEKGFSEFPSAMALAATGDPQNAYRVAAAMAAEMRAVGVNVDFAPDIDVNNNPANPIIGVRSFSSDPRKVAEYGLAFAKGLEDNGVLAFGKHFPGHGDTSTDSHITLPLVPHDRARLDAIELVPFRAFAHGKFAGIMTAHVTFPAIDGTPGLPATLSRPVLTGLLREELGYNGLIVTDSLEMGALAESGFPPENGAPLALAAGADLLLFNRDHDMHRQAFANLAQAVRDGKIPMAQVDASVQRILQAKERFGLLNPAPVKVDSAASAVKTAENLALSREIARQAMTLLRDPANLLPLHSGKAPLLVEPPAAGGLLKLLGLGGTTLVVDAQPSPAQIADVLHAAGSGRTVLVVINDLDINPGQLELVQKLVEAGAPVIVIAHRNPFDAALLPDSVTVLITYGFNPPMREALAEVLAGKTQPNGILPVSLPSAP